VTREQLFLVSKLWNNSHRPEHVEADLDTSLRELETDYLDVWLIHWPVPFKPGKDLQPVTADGKYRAIDVDAPGIASTWKELVRIYNETNKVRAIGVSNFNIKQLETIIAATGIVPVMNQIECHPSLIQPELFEFCEFHWHLSTLPENGANGSTGKKKGIVITAYSPLGNNITGKPRIIDAPAVQAIAKRLGKSPAQVLIAWCAHQGFCVIPKSVTPSRIAVSSTLLRLRKTVS
jgi:L-glyceraldehyde reductase